MNFDLYGFGPALAAGTLMTIKLALSALCLATALAVDVNDWWQAGLRGDASGQGAAVYAIRPDGTNFRPIVPERPEESPFLGLGFSAMLLLGVPVAITLAAITIFAFVKIDNITLFALVPQRMVTTAEDYVLLAIPFFIMAGSLMNSGGITERIYDFAVAMVGFMMLTGRMNWRFGATVIIGCFILFGAGAIVSGIQAASAG